MKIVIHLYVLPYSRDGMLRMECSSELWMATCEEGLTQLRNNYFIHGCYMNKFRHDGPQGRGEKSLQSAILLDGKTQLSRALPTVGDSGRFMFSGKG